MALAPDVLTGILGLSGLAGALLRSSVTRGWKNVTGDTVTEVIVGFVMGIMWNIPIGGFWPIIDFRETGSSKLAAATIVFFVAYSAADLIAKKVIGFIRAKAQSLPGDDAEPVKPTPPNGKTSAS